MMGKVSWKSAGFKQWRMIDLSVLLIVRSIILRELFLISENFEENVDYRVWKNGVPRCDRSHESSKFGESVSNCAICSKLYTWCVRKKRLYVGHSRTERIQTERSLGNN